MQRLCRADQQRCIAGNRRALGRWGSALGRRGSAHDALDGSLGGLRLPGLCGHHVGVIADIGNHVVAGGLGRFRSIGQFLGALPGDQEVRCLQLFVGEQVDTDTVALLDRLYGISFLVEEKGGHFDRQFANHSCGVILHSFVFDDAHDCESQGLDVADAAAT